MARLAEAGVRVIPNVAIWGAFGPGYVLGTGPGERWTIRPKRLVLATGAYERGVPLPGWTLPGVLTTGAAQTLMRSNQVSPGMRVLISGNGPLNMQVAAELAEAGVTVVALVELARASGRAGDPAVRQDLAGVVTAVRLLGMTFEPMPCV